MCLIWLQIVSDLDTSLGLRVERVESWKNTQCSPLPRGARIGEVPQAEGFGNSLWLRVESLGLSCT